jgi:hypothetical protein
VRGLLEVRFGAALDPPAADGGRARRLWTETLRAKVAALSGQATSDAFAPVVEGS